MSFAEMFESFFGVEMTPVYIVSQIIGMFGMLGHIISYQSKNQKKIMLWQLAASVCFILSFLLQGGYTGMALNIISAVRSIVYSNVQDKKWANSIFFPIALSAASVIAAAVTWNGWASAVPLAGQMIFAFSHRAKNPKTVRILSLPGSACWMLYNILIVNISGIATEVFISSSIIVGICRYDIPRKKS
ncbi:MAG: YgjV family protein [Clostridia bacterium]|nr:YgjV family protein [Clostridia bacterium]